MAAPGTSSGSSLYQGIAKGIADSYGVQRSTPNRFLADVGNYASILGAVDLLSAHYSQQQHHRTQQV
jgi:hypothetical protein